MFINTSCLNTTYLTEKYLSYWKFTLKGKKNKSIFNNNNDIVVLKIIVDITSIEFHTLEIELSN